MMEADRLEALALRYGIVGEYEDVFGQRHRVSAETKRALLEAMGVTEAPAGSVAAPRLVPPVRVVRQGLGRPAIPLTLPEGAFDAAVRWRLQTEDGTEHSGQADPRSLEGIGEAAGGVTARHKLVLPELGLGYHRLEVECGAVTAAACLIVAPRRCYCPAALGEGRRLWGLAVQLYAVRSDRDWGIGDFSTLRALLEVAAELGADFVGLNPLHALFTHNPRHASPYSPSSRLWLNVLYVDVEAVADFAECGTARALVEGAELRSRLQALRERELVDHEGVARAKLEVLDLLHASFRERHLGPGSARAQAFRVFQAEAGPELREHALFEALQEHLQREDASLWGWPVWPEAYRDPASEAVSDFCALKRVRVEFYEYLQWLARVQLESASRRSRELGLAVGIYQDLAVGIEESGSEAWAHQDFYALGARIGSPPDDFNPKGQDWGLLPPKPEPLRESAYAPVIAMLRAAMRGAGALRVDHVMGLMRLYWIACGSPPTEGAYVHYPFEDLLGALALESERNRCLIIGEDLGTVPDEVRVALQAHGVLSYRILYFEKGSDGAFKRPGEYPEQALAAASTHDLATLAGYWEGRDLEVRTALDLYASPEVRERQIVGRAEDRARLLLALEAEGLLPCETEVHPVSSPPMTPELVRAVYANLGRTPAKLLEVRLEDVFGQREQVNLPGTTEQHPNWRRRLPGRLEAWLRDPQLLSLSAMLREARGTGARAARTPAAAAFVTSRIPGATYRLQLNRDFGFAQATEIIPYLSALGITDVYASPYLRARPGSAHGYDIIDHNALNPEIGTAEEFEAFVGALKRHGMGHLLDLVPNHMGVLGADNDWWLDVLENGPAAAHARYFDIDWEPVNEALRGKVLVPVLGDHYGIVLEGGGLALHFDRESGSFFVTHHEHRFPIDPRTYTRVLGRGAERLAERLVADDPSLLEFQSLVTAFGHLPGREATHPEQLAERRRDKDVHKTRLADLCRNAPGVASIIEEQVQEMNGRPGDPQSYGSLHALLEAQAYRLAHWRVAAEEINYRRFFDINDLAALRTEDPEVFEATHRLVVELVASGRVQGLRIDHPDGLYDPADYFQRLQACFAAIGAPPCGKGGGAGERPLYIVVEKILAPYERLSSSWPVYGTTGYDFASLVSGLFVDPAAEARMGQIYATFTGERRDFDEILYRAKRLVMRSTLSSGLNVLANQLYRLAQRDWRTRDYTLQSLHDVLLEITACFPVYRTYITRNAVTSEDRRFIDWAVSVARRRSRMAESSIFDFVRAVLLTDAVADRSDADHAAAVEYSMKFQQYTGPVMAKGLEDTSFYIYHRLASLNEVGSDPRRFGVSVAAFHHANQERARDWPHALLATSTHDSKRSEDVRARLNVLSELPDEWQRCLRRWSRINRPKKGVVEDRPAPSRNDEYLLYQSLVAVWPLDPLDEAGYARLRQRLEDYMLKAVREGKVHSSWVNPNAEYEAALSLFVKAVFARPGANRFLTELASFVGSIARSGLYNSLSQTLIKMTAPGVPDIYQGNEVWDFSLVDPDNRRPVDYRFRESMLEGLRRLEALRRNEKLAMLKGLVESIADGRLKLYVTWKALSFRKANAALFREGAYHPLSVTGCRPEHVFAYARRHGEIEALVIVPRLVTRLFGPHADAFPPSIWEDTLVELPAPAGAAYSNILSGEVVAPSADGGAPAVALSAVLADLPVALLQRL